MEGGVLGQALEGMDLAEEEKMDDSKVEDPEKLSRDEKLEVEEKVAEALELNFEKHDKIAKLHNAEESEDSAMEESSTETEEEDAVKAPTQTNEVDEKSLTEENDEEPGNLQMAWEVLELAKNAFTKIAEKSSGEKKDDANLKLAESLLILGEVCLETEDYSQAAEDLTTCLRIRESSLPADSRLVGDWKVIMRFFPLVFISLCLDVDGFRWRMH